MFLLRNGGEVLYEVITQRQPHPDRGTLWNEHGLGVANEKLLQVVGDGKITELTQRTVDPNAVPCIIPFQGSKPLNSTMWIELKKNLETDNIKLPVDTQTHQIDLENDGRYFEMTTEELVDEMLPYAQIEELINECVNLSAEYKEGFVKLSEPTTGYKDRAVTLSYFNHLACLLDTMYNRDSIEEENDLAEVQLVW